MKLSAELVPVLIARDRNRATTDQILADRSTESVSSVLGPVVAKSSVLVSDGAGAYRVFARQAGIPLVALNLSAGEHAWGIYHVQNVNNYSSRTRAGCAGPTALSRNTSSAISDGTAPPIGKAVHSALDPSTRLPATS